MSRIRIRFAHPDLVARVAPLLLLGLTVLLAACNNGSGSTGY
jgi:hypothetical protein